MNIKKIGVYFLLIVIGLFAVCGVFYCMSRLPNETSVKSDNLRSVGMGEGITADTPVICVNLKSGDLQSVGMGEGITADTAIHCVSFKLVHGDIGSGKTWRIH